MTEAQTDYIFDLLESRGLTPQEVAERSGNDEWDIPENLTSAEASEMIDWLLEH